MYKNNWLKRGAVAAVAAGLMLGALPGVALAAEGDTAAPTVSITNDVADFVTKNYTGTVSTTEKFNFKVTYKGKEDVAGENTSADPTKDSQTLVVDESSWNFDISAPVNGDDTKWDQNDKNTKNLLGILGDVSFSKPGRYYFLVEELAGKTNSIAYSTQKFTIVVDVTWGAGYPDVENSHTPVIYGVKAYDATAKAPSYEKKLDKIEFTNPSADNLGTLSVTKKVAGVAANEDDEFDFDVMLNGIGNGVYYATVNGQNYKFENGKATTVKLGHKDTLTIADLPENATWTVTEKANGLKYDSTNVEDGAEKKDSLELNAESGADHVSPKAEGSKVEASANGTIAKGDKLDHVLFTNNKGFAPQTGITMNTLPFVGVAVVAAAGAVTLVISRKRRAGEEF